MIRASSILFWFGLSVVASLGLYHTSYHVHQLDQQLRELNASIETEQQNLHVLRAEWVYLSNPARIGTEARKNLASLRPTSPQQVVRLAALSDILPMREEATASVTVTGTPIANVHSTLALLTPHASPRQHKTVADNTHVNTYVHIERTASAQPLPDSINALLERYGTRP